MLPNLPRVTKILLIANIAGFALQWLLGDEALVSLMLWCYEKSARSPVRFSKSCDAMPEPSAPSLK